MGPVIVVSNQKGGVGKTTTASALIDHMRSCGIAVAGIDLDPQANLTSVEPDSERCPSAYELLMNPELADDRSVTTPVFGASDALVEFSNWVKDDRIPATRLAEITRRLSGDDYVLRPVVIDTPPARDALKVMALIAADFVVVPALPAGFSMDGVAGDVGTIAEARSDWPGFASRVGVFFNRVKPSTVLHQVAMERHASELKANGFHVFSTWVRDGIAVEEAQAMGRSVFDTRGVLRGPARQLRDLCEEIEEWCGLGFAR